MKSGRPRETDAVFIRGARENNLQNFDLTIPHDRLVVISGVSGSGKSTLAFDTIYAEGGRRYIETFSPYTRQFLDRLHRPDIDSVSGMRPALALEQQNRTTSSRSTVGTITEINDFLKILWPGLSDVHCPQCSEKVRRDTAPSIADQMEQTLSQRDDEMIIVTFPLNTGSTASLDALIETLQSEGFLRHFCRSSRAVYKLSDLLEDRGAKSSRQIDVLIDRIAVPPTRSRAHLPQEIRDRLLLSINQAYLYGHGRMGVALLPGGKDAFFSFSDSLSCARCGLSFRRPTPAMFSFNSPLGACPVCRGFGRILALDPGLCIPDPSLSIAQGAVACWKTKATEWEFSRLKRFCRKQGIDINRPWRDLSLDEREFIFTGDGKKKGYEGVKGWFDWLEKKTYKMHVRVFLSRYRHQSDCPSCCGGRLQPQALLYRVAGRTLPEVWKMPLSGCLSFFRSLSTEMAPDNRSQRALEEVCKRLSYLVDIGLSYLTLDRQTRTLSGGESQRVNLTALLGSGLVNTLLVLDEPTIGLHTRDTARLLKSLIDLRDRGNTVVVVEHDIDIIRNADEVLDLGPGAGEHGGRIVYQGPIDGLTRCEESLTGRFLNGSDFPSPRAHLPTRLQTTAAASIKIRSAAANNLKNIDVCIPLGSLAVLTGVSGSGKSSLLNDCLYRSYRRLKQGMDIEEICRGPDAVIKDLRGTEDVDDILLIDQNPVGKTPRSNPATYSKAWEIIRDCLAETAEAQRLGLSKSAFSFNVDGGRCRECQGAGYHRIEMQFLADVFVECEACAGTRFQDRVQTVRYAGKNVTDFLNMTLSEVVSLFADIKENEKARRAADFLRPLVDLGLGYLRLGQPLNKLSGGEAQRVKLASHMRTSGREKCLFLLDEPTTGLHPSDITKLIDAFRALIDLGHSVLCIEHNFQLIRAADWLIDLGPEGGEQGGYLLAQGKPSDLLSDKQALSSSPTLSLLRKTQALSPGQAVPADAAARRQEAVTRLKQGRKKSGISVIGARHHNLKNIDVTVPANTITAITGVSGSGKSTLAFDIIFNEGQRRYIDCLSPYARQFITQLEKPDVDAVHGIPPTIAVSQKTAPPLGLSTVATTTEIYQYLRLLFAKVGEQHCPEHDLRIGGASIDSIASTISEEFSSQSVYLFAPAVSGRKGHYRELFSRALRAELNEARVDGKIVSLFQDMKLERHKPHWISLLVASLSRAGRNQALLQAAVEQCLLLGSGTVEVAVGDKNRDPQIFSTDRVCPKCRRGFRALDPQDFSFRSQRGACKKCGGQGHISKLDQKRASSICPACQGSRIGPLGRHVYVGGRRIDEVSAMTAPELLAFLRSLSWPKRLAPIVAPVLSEINQRLAIISAVGLDYLRLNREASTISGGEAQRLRLARTLGQPLSGICYVLDEPTIGLHPSDLSLLMKTLCSLRDAGNTVIVVEHDEETIRQADYVIDIGPGGGTQGGRLVAAGSFAEFISCPESLTAEALRERDGLRSAAGQEAPSTARKTRKAKTESFQISGACTNNLRNVTASFPLEKLTVVAGVSGAGKSSLVRSSLVPAFLAALSARRKTPTGEDNNRGKLSNHGRIRRLLEIDQTPIGKTSTSTPASYIGIFADIRAVYGLTPEARIRGWEARHFSFNRGSGRCEACGGRGSVQVPMSFLPKATAICEICNGLRYNETALGILYQGLSIGELLGRTLDETREIFAHHKRIRRALDPAHDLGLGYLTLGQPTYTLSGGEAQRLKIARELGSREAPDTLYILDEPTIGLHMADIAKLLGVLQRLIAKGSTVIIIEHNLDVIRAADHLIELGPGPAERGGRIVFSGPPSELARSKIISPTRAFLSQNRVSLDMTTCADV